MFVIRRARDGYFVAQSAHPQTYTDNPAVARTWNTREEADLDVCPNKEYVDTIERVTNRRLHDPGDCVVCGDKLVRRP